MVVLPDEMDPLARQRVEWGQNIEAALNTRGWSRKKLIRAVDDAFGIEISAASIAGWISGQWAPRADVQAALSEVLGIPHHMLFPPCRLQRKTAAA